jgi:hypothetical protein
VHPRRPWSTRQDRARELYRDQAAGVVREGEEEISPRAREVSQRGAE